MEKRQEIEIKLIWKDFIVNEIIGIIFMIIGVFFIFKGIKGMFTKLREKREWEELCIRMKERYDC